jgi:hypothetical protein
VASSFYISPIVGSLFNSLTLAGLNSHHDDFAVAVDLDPLHIESGRDYGASSARGVRLTKGAAGASHLAYSSSQSLQLLVAAPIAAATATK